MDLKDVVETIGGIVKTAIPVVAALALLYFFWGLAKYIFAAGDENQKSDGRTIMIWGVIALFVMVSVWGLVGLLENTFLEGISTSDPNAPSIGF